MELRGAQGRLLLPPSARTIRWGSFPVIAGLALLVAWSGQRKGGNPAAIALPVATALLCVWVCFLFDDPAAETTAGGPTPLLFRRAVRIVVAVPAVTAVWFMCTWIGPLTGPSAAMTGSFVAEMILALAAAAVVVRLVGTGAGLIAAGVVVLVTLILPVTFGRPPSVDPARPPWGEPASYWTAVAVLAVLVLALAHLDPARARDR
ncbi:MAG: hypothetical protein ABJB55_09970 [Actinomycetota bacterium]